MNKNAFFDSSSSEASSNEDSDSTEATTLFETLFHDNVLAEQMNQFDPEAFRLNRLIECVAADIYDEEFLARHIDNINRYLQENIEQTMQGLLLAKMLISCKHYVAIKLMNQIDADELQFSIVKTQTINKILSRVAPKLILVHHNPDEPGVVRIEHEGQVIAFFKVGALRQQNDEFLHQFYLHLKKQMQLDDTVAELFPASAPIAIALAQIDFPEGSDRKEALYFSTIERKKNNFYEHCVNTEASQYSDWACVSGGIQAALPAWDHEGQPFQNFLMMLSVILILGGRDVRENGIMANGTIIDFEDFLEAKTYFPNIHIPFIANFSHKQPELGHWHILADYLKQLDLKQIANFMKDYPYEIETIFESPLNLCRGEEVDLQRREYVYPMPTFRTNKLLSREQITLCTTNIKKLMLIVENICEEKEVNTTLFKLIARFDPRWEKQVFQLDAIRHSIEYGTENCFYDPATIKAYSKSVGANRRSPELMAGNIARTPSPTMNQTELFEAFLSSAGTIIEKANIDNLARSLDAVDVSKEIDATKFRLK